MKNRDAFIKTLTDGYTTKGDYIIMVAAMLDGKP